MNRIRNQSAEEAFDESYLKCHMWIDREHVRS